MKGRAKHNIYKIFSYQAIEDAYLDQLFKERTSVFRHVWTHAYPKLKPGTISSTESIYILQMISIFTIIFVHTNIYSPIPSAGMYIPPFRLAKQLYYVNAMESVFSVIEGSSVAAQNVVNLLTKDLTTA